MPIKNVLLITADEMRADCARFMGNPDIQTPNLDALAARGTVFDNRKGTGLIDGGAETSAAAGRSR